MQKRSHILLARILWNLQPVPPARLSRWAFIFGSVQPDCNPFSYLKGGRRLQDLSGHTYKGAQRFIRSRIRQLQSRRHWNFRHYYTLGKITHYLADAFTYPHNEPFEKNPVLHHIYESKLRQALIEWNAANTLLPAPPVADLAGMIDALHLAYTTKSADPRRDLRYILTAAALLVCNCVPACLRQPSSVPLSPAPFYMARHRQSCI